MDTIERYRSLERANDGSSFVLVGAGLFCLFLLGKIVGLPDSMAWFGLFAFFAILVFFAIGGAMNIRQSIKDIEFFDSLTAPQIDEILNSGLCQRSDHAHMLVGAKNKKNHLLTKAAHSA